MNQSRASVLYRPATWPALLIGAASLLVSTLLIGAASLLVSTLLIYRITGILTAGYRGAARQWPPIMAALAFLIPADLIDGPQATIELRLVDPLGQAQPFQIYHLWAYQGWPQTPTSRPRGS